MSKAYAFSVVFSRKQTDAKSFNDPSYPNTINLDKWLVALDKNGFQFHFRLNIA
jgi:hypothetical protein